MTVSHVDEDSMKARHLFGWHTQYFAELVAICTDHDRADPALPKDTGAFGENLVHVKLVELELLS